MIKIKKSTPPPKGFIWHPIHFVSLGFGTGLSPIAPGTVGTLAALPIYFILMSSAAWVYVLVTALLLLLGIHCCEKTTQALNVHDHGSIVWDEVVGFLITLFLVPTHWLWIVIGFFLFRFFDVLKPWPIRKIDDTVHGGFGIMLDDVLAGIYACVSLHIVIFFWPMSL